MENLPLPPLSYLRTCLRLIDDGSLFWKRRPMTHFANRIVAARWNGRYASKAAGTAEHGYRKINIDGKRYYSHRIVFYLATGTDPAELQVDHADGDTSNNRPANLRLATREQNASNSAIPRNNRTGIKGVCWSPSELKWRAQLTHRGTRHSALFDSITGAETWVTTLRQQLHAEFARSR